MNELAQSSQGTRNVGSMGSTKMIIIQNYPLTVCVPNENAPSGYDRVDVDEAYLRSLFSNYGTVNACCVYNRICNSAFAQMTFANDDEAYRAYTDAQQNRIKIGYNFVIVTLLSQDTSLINQLNNDCLIAIFSKLNHQDKIKIEEVCQRWKELAPEGWNNVETLVEWKIPGIDFEACLSRSGPHLNTLGISSDRISSFLVVSEHCKNINNLEINLRVNRDRNVEMVEMNPVNEMNERDNMNEVDEMNDMNEMNEVEEINEMNEAEEMDEMEEMEEIVEINIPVEVKGMCEMLPNLTKLKCLTLYAEDLLLFTTHVLETLPESIEEIRVTNLFISEQPIFIPQDVSRLHNLKCLEFSYFAILENSIQGWESLRNLKHLSIIRSFIAASIVNELQNLTTLTVLNVSSSHLTNEQLEIIIRRNRALEEVDIKGLEDIHPNTMKLIATLPNLKSLRTCVVEEFTLREMTPMPKLEFLDCSDCGDISLALYEVIRLSPLLRYLNIKNCNLMAQFFRDAITLTRQRRNGVTLCICVEMDQIPNMRWPRISTWSRVLKMGPKSYKNLTKFNKYGFRGFEHYYFDNSDDDEDDDPYYDELF